MYALIAFGVVYVGEELLVLGLRLWLLGWRA